MSALGNIYDGLDDEGDGPRGRDLNADITVARSQLGQPFTVRVPLVLTTDDGARVRRALSADDEGDGRLQINLPADMPDAATLRLRGLGEKVADGAPGDLYLAVTLVAQQAPTRPVGGWWVAGLILIATLAGWALSR